jgi:tetratricopeptide (TPR) repeat protein
LICLVVLAACAGLAGTQAVLENGGSLPRRAEVAGVPFFPQERYYCGPAALATALSWSGLEVSQRQMAGQVYTPGREGTLRTDVVSAARRNGRLAVPVRNLPDLLAEIAAGHPVLVFQNLGLSWFPQWHYAVAVAYDLDAQSITLRSGLEARRVTDLATFERTWARGDYWALVVLPPEVLPVVAEERTLLEAALGLEQAGRPREAALAYRAIVRRWPESYAALIGLGNTLFAEGDYYGAAAAFRRSVALRPAAAQGWNNLAYALAEQEAAAAALEAAQRAAHLGRNEARYHATLREISEKLGGQARQAVGLVGLDYARADLPAT